MSGFDAIAEEIRALRSENEDLRRRLASVVMTGQVKEISGDRVRLEFDEKDASTGKPFRSPLIRRADSAGANGQGHKERRRPVIGETMMMISPNGEIGKHSRAMPYGPTDDSAEPAGDAGFSRIFSDGGTSLAIRDGEIRIRCGGVTVSVTASGIDVAGGHVKHDGKNIGKNHVHGGVLAGPVNTDVPSN